MLEQLANPHRLAEVRQRLLTLYGLLEGAAERMLERMLGPQ
jgi:hypothetical protein